MEKKILEAIKEMEGLEHENIEEARKDFSPELLLDIWLRYEGITGYTNQIINVMQIANGEA